MAIGTEQRNVARRLQFLRERLVREDRFPGTNHILCQTVAEWPPHRIGLALIPKVEEPQLVAVFRQHSDVHVVRVHQVHQDKVQMPVVFAAIYWRRCKISDAIERRLQLLRAFPLRDVNQRALEQQFGARLRLEDRNALQEPYGRAVLPPILRFVIV